MDAPGTHEVTQLLVAWSDGDEAALDRLAPLVSAELHRLAKCYMSREREDHLLQTSALINEAYLRLINWKDVRWQNRAHFFGVAAQMMRRILVDFARQRPRVDKGVEAHHIALDEALRSLAGIDERKSKIVELRFFGGLSVDETAAVMKVAPITVMREWNKAKAWLYRELSRV
ncbi:MAG TPA: ECF-type sigma factor [Pyrinomonadaceae bacterium]|jgi:RNA polymerase sigma factor (TIGR02999 family)|nr:ECF-type sigma factor [Pyrinomonadaceae bacterium]